jgi:crotonobetainyl-CoA:carnitine CoA-transferase CaiB-like acyl-CoA transferase
MSPGQPVLDGVTVLDLSWGISGPMAAMLLADHGADVIKIESPAGDPFAGLSGYQVWQRGKRSVLLDLRDGDDAECFRHLVRRADVLVESFSPGTTAKLGIDYEALSVLNPRLVYCSITGYGSTGPLADRPGIDALVAARTGQQWEARGLPGGTVAKLSGVEGFLPGVEAPDALMIGAQRPGPLFGGVPWVSVGAFYLASIGISAALRAREVTGRGQWVQTSLLQGALVTTTMPWQRAERPETPDYQTWICEPRAPKGFFRCSDGRWIHNWTPLPSFILGSSKGDHLEITPEVTAPRAASNRISLAVEEMIVLWEYIPQMAEAAARFSSEEWAAHAARVGVPVQPIRSPEEALDDPLYLADGCVIEVDDPDIGPVRQVGSAYRLSACPDRPVPGPARRGAHTDEVKAWIQQGRGEAEADDVAPPATSEADGRPELASPLDGILVLDLGIAIAGPFGAMLLGQLGARVIKVQPVHDGYWMSNHTAIPCNMGKESIGVNLKTEEGLSVLYDLVTRADVMITNMHYEAAERLGVDYETLRKINPGLVYCHTRGFEHGPRDPLPGNDQTGSALSGVDWLDGGLDDDGMPIWPNTSLGDTGNGLLAAIAMVQALYHRDRTGVGQFIDTSIIYAHLLNSSMAWKSADGSKVGQRQSLDAGQLGWSVIYRLYATADDWLCLCVMNAGQWESLCSVLDDEGVSQYDFDSVRAMSWSDAAPLANRLQEIFASRKANDWYEALDGAGVPCEVTHEDRVVELFDDTWVREKRWIAGFPHRRLGQVEAFGHLIDFSETPGVLRGTAPILGQNSRQILAELGRNESKVDELIAAGIVVAADDDVE